MKLHRVDAGTLELGGGLETLVRAALESVPVGGELEVATASRAVAFELMPPEFTLYELQRTVEAIGGVTLHKQNFRRALERTGLVEALGRRRVDTGGRPAELFRFDRERAGAGGGQGGARRQAGVA